MKIKTAGALAAAILAVGALAGCTKQIQVPADATASCSVVVPGADQ